MLFWVIAIGLIILYYIIIGYFFYGWLILPDHYQGSIKAQSGVTIIVPVRNEEVNIRELLNNLTGQDYPQNLIEIIIVDDHSSDRTREIVESFRKIKHNVRYVCLGNDKKGKKAAIKSGVTLARFPFILTTDADCRPVKSWVRVMAGSFESTGADLVSGPLILDGIKNFFGMFQQLEAISLLGTTAGAISAGNPVMCSAANLGYKKSSYNQVFDIHYEDVSSGDDVFLLFALLKKKGIKIIYVKNTGATVFAKAEHDLRKFTDQRKRWTSKTVHYKNRAAILTAIVIFMTSFFILVNLLAGLFSFSCLIIASLMFIFKSLIDFPFLYYVAGYFKKKESLVYFPLIQFAYIFYINYIVFASFIQKSYWKGRVVRY